MLSVRVVIFQNRKNDASVFVRELFFKENFVKQLCDVSRRIAKRAAAQSAEHQRIVTVHKSDPQNGSDFVPNNLHQVVGNRSVEIQPRTIYAGYGYETQLASLVHQAKSVFLFFSENCRRGSVNAAEVSVHRILAR